LAGSVKIRHQTADGRETVFAVLGPGDVFGELALFDPGPRTSTVITLTEVETVRMDRHALRTWMAERPEIAEQLLRVLARRLRHT
ncbi:cyclic nucleotide-binding domain-containing protein, partial [Mycobacterium kansasii]